MYSYSTDCTVQTKKELATYIAHTCFQQTFFTHTDLKVLTGFIISSLHLSKTIHVMLCHTDFDLADKSSCKV